MDKKIKIAIGVILAVSIGCLVWLGHKKNAEYLSDKKFLSSLGGEIVYTDRDAGILNLYKISADGENKKLIYHNSDSTNSNILKGWWSKDGLKIYFDAMKNGRWSFFSINTDGTEVNLIGNNVTEPLCPDCESNSEGIFAKNGNLYYSDAENKPVKVFNCDHYNSEFSRGAGDGYNILGAIWSPDKKFIAFESCGCNLFNLFNNCDIMIANKEGTKVVKLTSGQNPDWKY